MENNRIDPGISITMKYYVHNAALDLKTLRERLERIFSGESDPTRTNHSTNASQWPLNIPDRADSSKSL